MIGNPHAFGVPAHIPARINFKVVPYDWNWAGSGRSASDAIVAKADLHLAHGYDQSECGSPIMAYLHALGTLNSVRASFILDCDRFLLIASVCRTPMTVVSMQLLI